MCYRRICGHQSTLDKEVAVASFLTIPTSYTGRSQLSIGTPESCQSYCDGLDSIAYVQINPLNWIVFHIFSDLSFLCIWFLNIFWIRSRFTRLRHQFSSRSLWCTSWFRISKVFGRQSIFGHLIIIIFMQQVHQGHRNLNRACLYVSHNALFWKSRHTQSMIVVTHPDNRVQ